MCSFVLNVTTTVNMENDFSVFIGQKTNVTESSYQLNPGVDTDSDGIHRLHVVPPVSGNKKHLCEDR